MAGLSGYFAARAVYPYLDDIDEKSLYYETPDDYEKIFKDMFAMYDALLEDITIEEFDDFFRVILDFRYETGLALEYVNETMSTADEQSVFLDKLFDGVLPTIAYADWHDRHIHDGLLEDFHASLQGLRNDFQMYNESEIDELIDALIDQGQFSRYADVIDFLDAYDP